MNAIHMSSRPPESASGALSCWRRGTRLFLRAPVKLFVLAALAQYALLLPDWLPAITGSAISGLSGLFVSAAAIWLAALCYAALILQIDVLAAGGRAGWRQAARAALSLAVAGVIYNVAVAIGLVLLLLPAVFFSIALLFFAWPIVLEGRGPLAALGQSWRWTLPRFGRVSAAISIAFLVYGAYSVLTWWPSIAGVAWQPLAVLLAAVRDGAVGPMTAAIQAQSLVVPGPVAAPVWYFGMNPLLGGLVMPPVLAVLYEVYCRLRAAETQTQAEAAASAAS
ncbi:MAG TPA: hypothetical protein VFH57_02930 [Gammaproteobacteria bacterium]|nr:hypothetical protein [Gammaproteobacteria bacterium]